jgi:hypothetical protein
MAFTEAQLIAQIDSTGTGRVVTIENMNVGASVTDLYCVGVVAPYAGKSRWVQVPNTNTAAQTWTAIQAALA